MDAMDHLNDPLMNGMSTSLDDAGEDPLFLRKEEDLISQPMVAITLPERELSLDNDEAHDSTADHIVEDETDVVAASPVNVCQICQRDDQDGRPLLRFLPIDYQQRFTEAICLHVFCGKTATILGHSPHLEILTKAGLKNKHGIGPEVNAALARTRHAVIPGDPKQYYLVREFETHLSDIRQSNQQRLVNADWGVHAPSQLQAAIAPDAALFEFHESEENAHADFIETGLPGDDTMATNAADDLTFARGRKRRRSDDTPLLPQVESDGKHRCLCGGTYWPTDTPKGQASWRAHLATKRHQKWLEGGRTIVI
jgi:hypothetical protein